MKSWNFCPEVLCTGIWTYSFQGLLDHLHSIRTLWFYPDIKQTRQYLVTGFLCQFSIKFTSDLLICKIKIHNVINIVTLTQERRFHFHHLNHICTAMLYILKSENSSHCLTEIELTEITPCNFVKWPEFLKLFSYLWKSCHSFCLTCKSICSVLSVKPSGARFSKGG